jgi:hypothetical protein
MKNLIIAAALLLPVAAFANSSVATTSTNAASSQSAGGNQGQSLSIDSHEVVGGTRYAANSAFAPALTSSNDTCMGSSSMGASGMSFGFGIGTTWTDNNCRMLKNARELWNQGEHAASLALLCTDEDIRYSISVSGGVMDRRSDASIIRRGCPMSRDEWVAKGRPLLDPATGEEIPTGTVVQAAPLPKPVTTASVDAKGVVTKITPIYKPEADAHAVSSDAPAVVSLK